MRMSHDVVELCARTDLGLAPHYAFLWSAVVGVEAQRVFEFGAGGSTAVILDALRSCGGKLHTASTDPVRETERFNIRAEDKERWMYIKGLSERLYDTQGPVFDLVLHDGSHTGGVVEADLTWILPQVRQFGLVLVHDTQYERCREGMCRAVKQAMWAAESEHGMEFSHTTLPYAAGLTIIRVEKGQYGLRMPKFKKDGDAHGTHPMTL